ncbi:MAG: hypothetical protein ABIH46_00090 [Chloroflexota bacterium]
MGTSRAMEESRFEFDDDYHEINEFFCKQHWTDGLPVVPPTEEAVMRMVAATARQAEEVVGRIPPRWAEATTEKIAANAVMAGCRPEYMPVVLAAVEAMLPEEFNLHGMHRPLLTLARPWSSSMVQYARSSTINCRYGVFGPGWRANATIGRALRLVLLNIGGGWPGELDRSTLGQPGKYTFCIGENEEESPWAPLHVERGFQKEDSTVTVVPADAPRDVLDRSSTSARGVLLTCACALAALGCSNTLHNHKPRCETILALCPEHAGTIAREEWTKDAVKQFMSENAGLEIDKYGPEVGAWRREQLERDGQALWPDGRVPLGRSKEDIVIIVTGGAGKHSACLTVAGAMASVTRLIRKPDHPHGGSP